MVMPPVNVNPEGGGGQAYDKGPCDSDSNSF